MKVIISLGDCNGIGLEVFYKAVLLLKNDKFLSDKIHLSIAGNKRTIKEYFNSTKFELIFSESSLLIEGIEVEIKNISNYSPINFGEMSVKSAILAIESLDYATKSVLEKKFDAIITLPINKHALQKVGWKYPGHTEFLANECKSKDYLMILMSGKIRVALTTTHIPISEVPKKINQGMIEKKAQIFYHSLKQDFSIKNPKIAAMGLNPHAGENGSIGKEELEKIIPALLKLNEMGARIAGPFPADGFFAHSDYKNYDGILAMYHDQGLIPLKILAKNKGVNYTANLPIVRTSPDHGTAYQIAGHGIADGQSTYEAIKTAFLIAKNRKKFQGI